MGSREDWKARRDALTERMKQVQAAVIADLGGLELPEYRRRLAESGLLAEWNALQLEPGAGPDLSRKE